jgi:hypothetical protein
MFKEIIKERISRAVCPVCNEQLLDGFVDLVEDKAIYDSPIMICSKHIKTNAQIQSKNNVSG